MNKISKFTVCYVTDRHTLDLRAGERPESALLQRIEYAAGAGVDWIQIREKDLPARQLLDLARRAIRVCHKVSTQRAARILINDRFDVAWAAGAAGRAARLHEAAMPGRIRALGPDHPGTLTAQDNLANAYRDDRNVHRAIPLREAILAARRRVLGNEHRDTLATMSALATDYGKAGDLDRAIKLHESTLATCIRVYGPDHPVTRYARRGLARAFLATGSRGRAIPLLEANLDSCTRVLGPSHRVTNHAQGELLRARG